jgi:4'-phosphopantetheinyl transferase EntD
MVSRALTGLFPQAVRISERQEPGDPADLLPAEADAVARARDKRQREFAAGRACARAALAEFGVRGFALRAADDRQPVWPEGFVGSITHTAGFCAAAVAARSEMLAVGLDSEIVGAPTPDIWSTICREEEMDWLMGLNPTERPRAVTLVFSAKEAVYKCQYPLTGEWLDFHDFCIAVPTWGDYQGTFDASARRLLKFEQFVALPLTGRYVFHDSFVSAGAALAAAPQGARANGGQ